MSRAGLLDPETRLQQALDLALRQLGRRDRTVLEVRRYLEAKRVEPDTIAAAVERLGEMGYLDDARFAERFVEDRRRLDGWGRERIERRLTACGVAREIVDGTLADDEPGTEMEAALALLARRFPAPLADPRSEQRAFGVLVRKGYEPELAGEAVRRHRREGGRRS